MYHHFGKTVEHAHAAADVQHPEHRAVVMEDRVDEINETYGPENAAAAREFLQRTLRIEREIADLEAGYAFAGVPVEKRAGFIKQVLDACKPVGDHVAWGINEVLHTRAAARLALRASLALGGAAAAMGMMPAEAEAAKKPAVSVRAKELAKHFSEDTFNKMSAYERQDFYGLFARKYGFEIGGGKHKRNPEKIMALAKAMQHLPLEAKTGIAMYIKEFQPTPEQVKGTPLAERIRSKPAELARAAYDSDLYQAMSKKEREHYFTAIWQHGVQPEVWESLPHNVRQQFMVYLYTHPTLLKEGDAARFAQLGSDATWEPTPEVADVLYGKNPLASYKKLTESQREQFYSWVRMFEHEQWMIDGLSALPDQIFNDYKAYAAQHPSAQTKKQELKRRVGGPQIVSKT